MHNALAFPGAVFVVAITTIIFGALTAGEAHALDKVDPYICPTMEKGTGIDCFLEAIPQTYTMCRHIKSIEVLEFGLEGAQEGVNGAKTDGCIDKHKLSVNRPYQAALRAARNQAEVQSLRKLHATWLESMGKLRPMPTETDEGYKERVVEPYAEFSAQIKDIQTMIDSPLPTAPAVKRPLKKSSPKA